MLEYFWFVAWNFRIYLNYFLVYLRLLLGSAPLYLWRSSEEKVAVDLRLAVLANKDGAHVVFVA